MLYFTGKSMYAIPEIFMYMYESLLYFTLTVETFLDTQMIPIPLWTSTCQLQIRTHFLARTILVFLRIYFLLQKSQCSCLCSVWQLRSCVYSPEYGIGAFGTLPLMIGNR
jgi:hypothetical protein